uniref:Uncharacterized protein n=1 Tax=Cacopsylla melanoneura TaxID=428564 RepID=A0A8D9B3L6_9HEMI
MSRVNTRCSNLEVLELIGVCQLRYNGNQGLEFGLKAGQLSLLYRQLHLGLSRGQFVRHSKRSSLFLKDIGTINPYLWENSKENRFSDSGKSILLFIAFKFQKIQEKVLNFQNLVPK